MFSISFPLSSQFPRNFHIEYIIIPSYGFLLQRETAIETRWDSIGFQKVFRYPDIALFQFFPIFLAVSSQIPSQFHTIFISNPSQFHPTSIPELFKVILKICRSIFFCTPIRAHFIPLLSNRHIWFVDKFAYLSNFQSDSCQKE